MALRIAAQAVVLSEVPDRVTMVGPSARPVARRGAEKQSESVFQAYGIPGEEIPDPIARALNGLLDEVTSLRARLAELEQADLVRGGPRRVDQAEPHHGNGADENERVP